LRENTKLFVSREIGVEIELCDYLGTGTIPTCLIREKAWASGENTKTVVYHVSKWI